jgi:hypothetical protein
MCCELLEPRKATGQERARARNCPGNAATSKSPRIARTGPYESLAALVALSPPASSGS